MATYIYVTDNGGGVQGILNGVVQANREDLQQKTDLENATRSPEFIREFARSAGISFAEAAGILSGDEQRGDQALAKVLARQFLQREAEKARKDESTYQPDELSAQRRAGGYDVFSFRIFLTSSGTVLSTLDGSSTFALNNLVGRVNVTLENKAETLSSDTFRYTTKVGTDYSAAGSAVFPLGPDSCIFCLGLYYTGVAAELITEVEYKETFGTVSTPTCGLTRNVLLSQQANIISGGNTVVSSSYQNEFRCFYISRKVIREITAPALLRELLWTRIFSSNEPTRTATIQDGSPQFILPNQTFNYSAQSVGVCRLFFNLSGTLVSAVPGENISQETYDSIVGDLNTTGLVAPEIICSVSSTAITDSNLVLVCQTEEQINFSSSEPIYLSRLKPSAVFSGTPASPPPPQFILRNLGGIGVLSTPGIFSAIENAGVSVPANSELDNLLATYNLESAVPKVTLASVLIFDNEGNPVSRRFDYVPFLVNPTINYADDEIIQRQNRARSATVPLATASGESIISTWNWGNTAYCRQQLLALGFTAEDLTP